MKKTPTEMKELKIRRITLTDAQTVRYRVYTTPADFVAVIAENALMAMKLTGINQPHKIVRDLITSEGSIAPFLPEKTMVSEYILPTKFEKITPPKPDIKNFTNSTKLDFEALPLSQLQKKSFQLNNVVPPATLIRVLAPEEPTNNTPDATGLPTHHASPETLTTPESADSAPLISDVPLSPQDVVELLSPNAD